MGYFRRRQEGAHMETIHCIGDSHCCFFYGQEDKVISSLDRNDGLISFFKVYIVGPSLAYNLCQEGTKTGGRENLFDVLNGKLAPGSTVLLCFGEIDCRAHLLKRAELKQSPLEDVVEECVVRYFEVVKEIKAKGFKVLLWAVVPSAHDSAPVDLLYPRYGTCQDRNRVTMCFNEKLERLAKSQGIPFISIFEKLVGSDGLGRDECFMDQIHLSQRVMPLAIDELRKNRIDIPSGPLPSPLRLHIGGTSAREGWTIVNPKQGPGADLVASCTDLSFFGDDSVDEVYVSGQLEKLSYKTQLGPALKEICRIVKRSGLLRISVPDFEVICRVFLLPGLGPQQRFDAMKAAFGAHGGGEGNKLGLTLEFLNTYLRTAGFCHSRREIGRAHV